MRIEGEEAQNASKGHVRNPTSIAVSIHADLISPDKKSVFDSPLKNCSQDVIEEEPEVGRVQGRDCEP